MADFVLDAAAIRRMQASLAAQLVPLEPGACRGAWNTTRVEIEKEKHPGKNTEPTKHGMSYLGPAFDTPTEKLVAAARHVLEGVEYDTFVGRGLSGCLVVPLLGRALGKKFAIVRKDDEPSHGDPIEGYLGTRWIFVDDLVSSGHTRNATKAAVAKVRDEIEFIGELIYSTSVQAQATSPWVNGMRWRPQVGGWEAARSVAYELV